MACLGGTGHTLYSTEVFKGSLKKPLHLLLELGWHGKSCSYCTHLWSASQEF